MSKILTLVMVGMLVMILFSGLAVDAKPTKTRCVDYYTINPDKMKCEFVINSCLNLIWMGEYPLFMSMKECNLYRKGL